VVLDNSNRLFVVGEEADPRVRAAVLQGLVDLSGGARVTYLRLEAVGPRRISVGGDVDLTGDDVECASPSDCVRWRREAASPRRRPARS
jgi:hypothetical protein